MPKTMPDLSQFYGSLQQYSYPLCKNFLYTEGIHYLAKEVGAVWFITLVTSYQHKPEVKGEPFQLWNITLDGKGGCVVTMRGDSDQPEIIRQEIDTTDFPEDFECYCGENHLGGHTLMLKSEY